MASLQRARFGIALMVRWKEGSVTVVQTQQKWRRKSNEIILYICLGFVYIKKMRLYINRVSLIKDLVYCYDCLKVLMFEATLRNVKKKKP